MISPALRDAIALIGRVLLAAIFIQAGWGKIGSYAATQGFMQSNGVAGALLPLVIFTELVGGLALLIGYQARLVAFVLAGFTLVAGVLFHYQPGNAGQMIHFMKNVAIVGGFLQVVAFGAGAYSLDGVLSRRPASDA